MKTPLQTLISESFGDYRSEWRADLFSTLFIKPPYFDELEAPRPTFLEGGRGTGKTTALKSLRFDATALRRKTAQDGTLIPYLGVYLRINKNRAAAFHTSKSSEQDWDQLFAHYLNLSVCLELTRLMTWLSLNESRRQPSEVDLARLHRVLLIQPATNLETLSSNIKRALDEMETYVNNIGRQPRPQLSMAEAPIRAFTDTIQEGDERPIYCCIDEYENLSNRQQEIVNTYIKHSDHRLYFKVGVRRFGLRSRRTMNNDDLLVTPDDYGQVDIAGSDFEAFAVEVANLRLGRAASVNSDIPREIGDLLPGLSRKEEAKLLGAARIAKKVVQELAELPDVPETLMAKVRDLGPEAYFIRYWQEGQKTNLLAAAQDILNSNVSLESRLNNYGYASLFWISRGHKGALIRKYYCGLDTFISISSGNIRYFLDLLHESARQAAGATYKGVVEIDPRDQTMAARIVAKRRLDQLDGLSVKSMIVKRMVLAIGRVFFEYARTPEGHTPEQSSFVLGGTEASIAEVTTLLHDGVSNLAFEVFPRTKPTSPAETKEEDEYRIHPIYCPYFEFSHRKKRRATFAAESLLKINSSPRDAIRELLAGRAELSDDDPIQLEIFSAFYSGGTK